MLSAFLRKLLGSRNERTLRRMQKTVRLIESFEPKLKTLTDAELSKKTEYFREQYAAGVSLDDLLPEAFAVVREVSVRTLGLRHFNEQLLGGMVLHEGNIAEMRTGEGKTLTESLPAYLNAIPAKGVHIVTVNEYLAKRDSAWMRPIFEYLGLTVGTIYTDMPHAEKKIAYQADIVYGTNNEFGFDYLRDNMVFSLEEKVQRPLHYAIVDEVDSILIDEARTPLIISGMAEDSSALYQTINTLIPQLTRADSEDGALGDYTLDEKQKQVHLTESGHQHIEALLSDVGLLSPGESLYHASHIVLMHHVYAALKAHVMYHRDVDYIVQGQQVVIVDEHTGRTMPGRRWSEGLHQAMEAKEGVPIQHENQTLASITFQNLFRLYDKLSGMTGTADTEAYEFHQIYDLDVVVIPTHQPMIRKDQTDLVYLTQADKYEAVIQDVRDCVQRGQPVLVGTASIEASEYLSQWMHREKIQHQVLNAKFHEKEAQIIAEAGRPGAVTIATHMAGRGTDIVLGGSIAAELEQLPDDAPEAARQAVRDAWQCRHDKVIEAGGLRIIGSERHESRRIDNQLRGRAGRQGDPGSSRFYLSLDDALMRIFASERVASLMKRLGMKPGEPIEHPLVNKAIENAQKKLEGYHFDIRKQLLSYDNVANEQRKVIYTQRAAVIEHDDLGWLVSEMQEKVFGSLVSRYLPPDSLEDEWDQDGLQEILHHDFKLKIPIKDWLSEDSTLSSEMIQAKVMAYAKSCYRDKISRIEREFSAQFEKNIMLQTMDHVWREHLAAMDYLRQGIHLRGYAQKDPRQEYKREAFYLFSAMLEQWNEEVIKVLYQFETVQAVEPMTSFISTQEQDAITLVHETSADAWRAPLVEEADLSSVPRRTSQKIGRNDLCPCGSSKKYKLCHGRIGG